MIRCYPLPLILSLTTATVGVPLSVQAASFEFNQLQLIPDRPLPSNTFLSFSGSLANNQGLTAFFNPNPTAFNRGHLEISQNSPPGQIAPYYTTGRQSSPLANGATRSATLEGTTNFTHFFNYITTNNINFSEIGYGYGQKSDRAFTETWNLGTDILGQNWLASPTSTIEERIYQADPNAVESFLAFGITKFISFSYTPLYAVFDQGATTAISDNNDIFFTKASKATKVSGLNNPLLDGLANAFLQDVQENGGLVQVFIEDSAVQDPIPEFDPNTGFVVVNFPLPLQLRVVSVPEPSSVLGLLAVSFLSIVSVFKKLKN